MARVTEAGVNLPIMPLLPISSKQTTGFCRSLQLLDSDVFICSYPKSGTTWMQNIVVTLLTRGQHPDSNEHISDFAPFFEIDKTWDSATGLPVKTTEWPGGRRCFNTHLRWDQMPKGGAGNSPATSGGGGGGERRGPRYVYVMRDGKDVAASFYQHLSHQAGSGGFEGSFDDFFAAWLQGSLPYGRHVDHVKSWLLRPHQNQNEAPWSSPPAPPPASSSAAAATAAANIAIGAGSSVLVVYYEDMLSDLAREVGKVNDFLGLPELSPLELKSFAGLTSFASMKTNIERFQPKSVAWKPGFSFIRKGRAGDHKTLLSEAQVRQYKDTLKASFPVDVLTFRAQYFD